MRRLPLLRARLAAFLWARRAMRAARLRLAASGLDGIELPPVPPLPSGASGGVNLAFRLGTRNCLVRSAVRQAWDAAHGRPADLVIGVTAPGPGFRAHAWLDHDPPEAGEGFAEIARRPARPHA